MRCRAAAFCKTCELQAQSSNGFEVPNVTWATPFLFLLFLFPHLSFQSHISPFFQFSHGLQLHLFSIWLYGSTANRQPCCGAFFFYALVAFCVCVWNSVTKSPFHLYRIAGDHRGLVNEDSPGKPVQTYLPFFQTVWQPGSAEELDTVII